MTWQNQDYAYDAFGNPQTIANTGTEPYNPFGYCGEYTDSETGLVYLRARYLDTSAGRFVSEDPVCDGVRYYYKKTIYC